MREGIKFQECAGGNSVIYGSDQPLDLPISTWACWKRRCSSISTWSMDLRFSFWLFDSSMMWRPVGISEREGFCSANCKRLPCNWNVGQEIAFYFPLLPLLDRKVRWTVKKVYESWSCDIFFLTRQTDHSNIANPLAFQNFCHSPEDNFDQCVRVAQTSYRCGRLRMSPPGRSCQ